MNSEVAGARTKSPKFGKRLRTARHSKNLSIKQASANAATSEQQWRNYENGDQRPPLEKLELICRMLEMDLHDALRLYFYELLDHPETARTQSILGQWKQDTPPGNAAVAKLAERLHELPLDETTGDCLVDVFALLTRYRKNMTATTGSGKDLKVLSVNDSVYWADFEGSTMVRQHVVNASRRGLGHVATIIKIPSECGAYHLHVDGPYVDAGREFVAVLSGTGSFFVQHPISRRWKHYASGVGTAGSYPGNCGHCFVNTGGDPLHVFVVAIPFPPPLGDQIPRGHPGRAVGAEFRLGELSKADIPTDLRQILVECCVRPTTAG